MAHVAFVCFSGLRVREAETLALGMSLPGVRARTDAIRQLPPLGLLMLAGMTPSEWTCSFHEADNDPELVDRVLNERPNLVAVSALTASIDEAYRFSDGLRSHGVPVVLGGLHVTACPQEAGAHADAVVVGEGEPVWHSVLADAKSGKLAPQYRSSVPFDLGQTPLPRLELLGAARRQRYTLQTQRGCPLACEFCGASRLLGRFREKPLGNIRRELDAIRDLDDHAMIEWADDNSFAGTRNWDEAFKLFGRYRFRYFTESDWRIGERSNLLAALAASGCMELLIGFESLAPRHRGMGEKQAPLGRMLEAVEAIQQSGVAVNACFIVGADGETRQTLDQLASFLTEAPFAQIQLTIQTPFPGTTLHRRLNNQGRLLPGRGWPYYTLFDVAYQPDPLSVDELEAGFREVAQAAFSPIAVERRSEIRKRVWRSHPRRHACASETSGSI